jgi:hypothetical protein
MSHDYWVSVAVAMRSHVVPIKEPLVNYRLHSSNTMGLLPKYLLGHRLRYAFDSRYRRQLLLTRLSQLEDLARLLGDATWPRVTNAERESLALRIEKLRAGVSQPENLRHRISFVRRG